MTKTEAFSAIVKATHQMVTGFGLPSPYSDDHKWCKTTPLAERRRVIRFCETTDTQAKDWAMRVIEAAKVLEADSEFKNFHRLLCERFGYGHDPRNWRRDQLSLIEHIANSQAKPKGDE